MNIENKKKELQSQIYEFEEEVSSIEVAIATLDLQIESEKSKTERINLEHERNVQYQKLEEKKMELEKLRSQYIAMKRFNRERCLNNVDMLLTQKNKKLGELEVKSGNRPGYLSRMKSGKSNSDPSIEFLMTASDELEVPLDLLVDSNLADLTPTEKFMLEFMRQLISDTNNDKLEWMRETLSELEKIEITRDMDGSAEVSHPLYGIGGEGTGSDYYEFPLYNSLFFKDCGVRPCGDGYYTTLVPNDQKIYIMDCTKEDGRITLCRKRFFEIYMVEYDSYGNAVAKKICNTLEANSPLIAAINSLVKTIMVSVSHVHIDDSVRSAIDAYMGGKKTGDGGLNEELPFN